MNYTDCGTQIRHDWMPLAFANGLEWMTLRRDYADRLNNLYANRFSFNAWLWYIGAFLEFLFPGLIQWKRNG